MRAGLYAFESCLVIEKCLALRNAHEDIASLGRERLADGDLAQLPETQPLVASLHGMV